MPVSMKIDAPVGMRQSRARVITDCLIAIGPRPEADVQVAIQHAVIGEIFLDEIALVSERHGEVGIPVVRVVHHDVPEDR
jgi:hypothetical protein